MWEELTDTEISQLESKGLYKILQLQQIINRNKEDLWESQENSQLTKRCLQKNLRWSEIILEYLSGFQIYFKDKFWKFTKEQRLRHL